jgi:N-acetylmuramoyl-L-alanine amidase
LIPSRKSAAAILAILAGAAAIAFSVHAQPQTQIPMPAQQPPARPAAPLNRNVIVLDPAHGGSDPGATLGDHVLEKDINLALAAKLRTALAAAGFTVITTRDADPTDPLTTDQRAEIANRTHAVACIVLHATATGSGVHIYTSTVAPAPPDEDIVNGYIPIPWEIAQSASVDQSQRLAAGLSSAFTKSSLPALSGRAAVRPLDNLMCPAVAIELAPLLNPAGDPTSPADASYQQRVAAALASTLQNWRDQANPEAESTQPSQKGSLR